MTNFFTPFHKVLSATPTVSASPNYSDGDSIGGLISLAGAARANDLVSSAGFVDSVVIADKAANTTNIEVVFFDSNPTGTTFTDNSALTIADADLAKVAGVVLVDTWISSAGGSFGSEHTLRIPYDLGTGTVLYAAMIATGATDLATTSDLTVRVGLELD